MKKQHIMLCATIIIMTMLTACSSKEMAVSSNDVEEEGTNTAEDASDQNRAKDYQQTLEELKNTDESTHLNETIVPQEIIDHMHVIDDQHHIAYYEEVDMDGDGQLESIVATGHLDKDPYESDISHIYIVRLKDNNIQQLSDNLASGGYGVYDIRTVKLQHTPNKTYLYCRLSNGANLGGFNLYEVDKEDVEIVLHCSSSVGSGVDKLVDSDKDGLYDGYEKIRSSYDVLYYEITYAYTLENEEFMLSGMSINLPPYPDTIKNVLVQYLSLRLLDIGQSPELSSRLNELCTDQQANTIEIPYNYLHSALLNTILGLKLYSLRLMKRQGMRRQPALVN